MSEELQQKLRTQLWTVANTLRGNMSAGDFMYFTLDSYSTSIFRRKSSFAPMRYYNTTT